MVRNSILKTLVSILKKGGNDHFELVNHILGQVEACGEKYDINLQELSTICVLVSNKEIPIAYIESVNKSTLVLIELLREKGTDSLVKDIDVIRANLAL
jgi:uncharacterized protein YwgA